MRLDGCAVPSDAVEEMDEDACWSLGPFEGRLAGLQHAAGHGEMTRVPLRALFTKN